MVKFCGDRQIEVAVVHEGNVADHERNAWPSHRMFSGIGRGKDLGRNRRLSRGLLKR